MDLLHGVWLGIAKDVSGQIAYDAVMMYMPHTMQENLALLHRQMIDWYKEKGVHCGVKLFKKTTLSWESSSDYPTMEQKMKGAESKMVFMFLAWVAEGIVESGTDQSEYARLRACMAWALHDCIRVFDENGTWLSRGEADRAYESGCLFLQTYQRLAAQALAEGVAAYKLRPKFHEFAHLLLEAKRTRENPKHRDCFDSEDYIGKMKSVGAACHRRGVDVRACQRLIMFLSHRWRPRATRPS